jgi:hypothetical protein
MPNDFTSFMASANSALVTGIIKDQLETLTCVGGLDLFDEYEDDYDVLIWRSTDNIPQYNLALDDDDL